MLQGVSGWEPRGRNAGVQTTPRWEAKSGLRPPIIGAQSWMVVRHLMKGQHGIGLVHHSRSVPMAMRAFNHRCVTGGLALLLSLPAVGQAQFTYTTNDGTITITGYTGAGGAVIIPSTIDGLPVTSIGFNAFSSCSSLTSVTISNNVTTIGDYAFAYCGNLEIATTGGTVTSIGSSIFYACTRLTNVMVGSGVTSIGNGAFRYCSKLSSIMVDALNPSFASFDGVLFDRSQTVLIQYPGGKAGNYTFPDSVISIGKYAFSTCTNVTSVTIPDGVTNIGDHAFSACANLTSVRIPGSVCEIGIKAFNICTSLTNVDIANGVTKIAESAFRSCASLTRLTIPGSVTEIGDYAFAACSSLRNVSIPNSVLHLGGGAFYECFDLMSATLGTSVTNVAAYVLASCHSLTSIGIPDSVTTLDNWAFYNCTSLTNVMIPNGITTIGDYAFYWCVKLTGVFFQGNAPTTVGSYVFSGDNYATVYYLPGSRGWGPVFGDVPAVLWNPLIQSGDSSFGVQTNRFGFRITGATNIPVVVEAGTTSPSASWMALQTCTLTNGSVYFSDAAWTNYPARFYRVRSP
jgi:hypothetical protein